MDKALVVLENIRLHRLPGYSPELNLQEYLWDELRRKEYPNRVFSDMAGVVRTLEAGLPRLASLQDRVWSICLALDGWSHRERELELGLPLRRFETFRMEEIIPNAAHELEHASQIVTPGKIVTRLPQAAIDFDLVLWRRLFQISCVAGNESSQYPSYLEHAACLSD